jgi:polyhydroxybutyrate depolymerase
MPGAPHHRVPSIRRAARRRSQMGGLALAAIAAVALIAPVAGSSARATPAKPVAGCGHRVASGSTTLQMTVAGHRRVVIVHVPTGYDGTTAVALVLNLHGSGSTAAEQELFSGMDATADAHDFIVAYPQGLIANGTGFDWNVPDEPLVGGAAVPKGAASDVAFLSALVPALAARYCIDEHRVFATGVSGGGRMASQLACDAAATFAAVAPVAGLRFPSPCPAQTAVPVIAFHGTADPIDPFNGNGEAYWTYSVPAAARRWAAHDGCRATAHTIDGSGYALTTYSGCAAGSSVELYALSGEGHEWPGGPHLPASITALLGPQSNAVNADNAMWAFFTAHTARA